MFVRRLVLPLTFAAVAFHVGQVFAWTADPPEKWAASETCIKELAPLREEMSKHSKLIKAASERHAPADEACKLIGNYSRAEFKMTRYIDANWAECGGSLRIVDRLRANHRSTEATLKEVCRVAQQIQRRAPAGSGLKDVGGVPAGPVGDFWPASSGDFAPYYGRQLQ